MAANQISVIIRSFGSSATHSQLVKTPIPVFGVGGKYASALYSAAVKSKEVDKVNNDFNKFYEVLKSDKKFSQIIKDPTIKKTAKANMLKEVGAKLSFAKTSSNALTLIAENGRLKDFDLILNSFKTVMAAHRGEIPCEIVSAKPLSETDKKAIEDAIKKIVGDKKVLTITSKINSEIIGGLIVSIGDKYIDMSIASKIKKFTNLLRM